MTQLRSLMLAVVTIFGSAAISDLISSGDACAQTVNQLSVQITLRTHQQYYRGAQVDQDTWSWSPRIVFRVNGPIPGK